MTPGRVALLAVMSAALCGAAVTSVACGGERKQFRPLRSGDAAPMFRAAELGGEPLQLASLHGKVVVLNVWATWCVPCRREMPMLDSLRAEFAPRGVEVIGVSVDGAGADDAVKAFVAEYGIGFRILRDPESRISTSYQTRGVPETFLIDRDGRIASHWLGGVDTPSSGIRDSLTRVLAR